MTLEGYGPYQIATQFTAEHILQKHEYLGHTVNFKTRKHFKDKKSHYVDKDCIWHRVTMNILKGHLRAYIRVQRSKCLNPNCILSIWEIKVKSPI